MIGGRRAGDLLAGDRPRPLLRLWLLFAQSVTVMLAMAFVAFLIGGGLFTGRLAGDVGADAPATFSLAMKRVMPSVVSVRAGGDEVINDEDDFSIGSGVIVSADGYIITNAHVIRDQPTIVIETGDGVLHVAVVVGTDPQLDIAVLKVDPPAPLQPIRFVSSRAAEVGDLVVSVGSPFGLPGTATMGIVSATGRSGLGLARYEHFIQTDAAINHGSSGGALANSAGELVGISTALFSKRLKGAYAQGIGFAIPASLAQVAYEQIVEYGRFRRGWIGIEYKAIVSTRAGSAGSIQMLVTKVEKGVAGGRRRGCRRRLHTFLQRPQSGNHQQARRGDGGADEAGRPGQPEARAAGAELRPGPDRDRQRRRRRLRLLPGSACRHDWIRTNDLHHVKVAL